MKKEFFVLVCLTVAVFGYAQQIGFVEGGTFILVYDDGTWEAIPDTNVRSPTMITSIGDTGAFLSIQNVGFVRTTNSMFGPTDGMAFVGIEIIIDNRAGRESINLGHKYDHIQVSDDYSYDYTVTVNSDFNAALPEMTDERIPPGDIRRGWITVEARHNMNLDEIIIRYNEQSMFGSVTSDWIALNGDF